MDIEMERERERQRSESEREALRPGLLRVEGSGLRFEG